MGLLRLLAVLPMRWPKWTIAGVLLVTAVLGVFASQIRIDAAIEALLPTDDPARHYYQGVRALFGSEEATVIGVFGDVFAPETLAMVDRLSKQLAGLDGVREVVSVTTVKGVETDELGLRVGPVMRTLPTTVEDAEVLKKKLLGDPLYVGNVVSPDGAASAIVVLFEPLSDAEFLARDLEGQVRAAVDAIGQPDRFAITGVQTLKVNGARLMEQDLARFVPLSLLLVIVVLVLEFRTKRGVFLPLASVIIGTVWTTGVMVLAGAAINMGTLILPPLMMAIGVAYAIHVVSRYYTELRPGLPRAVVVDATVQHMRLPVAVAWLTTVLGCATLVLNPIEGIRDFGIYSVVGATAIFIVSALFIPACLMVMSDPKEIPSQEEEDQGRVSRAVAAIGSWAVSHRRIVLAGALALVAVSIWGTTKIKIETDYLEFFSPESVFRRDNARIGAALGGTQPFYVAIDGTEKGAMKRLEVLTVVRELQQFVAAQPGVDSTLSFADYVAIMQGALNPEHGRGLPPQQGDVDQLLLFVNPADIAPVVTKDYSRATIIVRSKLSGSAEVGALVQRIEEYGRSRLPEGITARVTGTVVLLNQSADDLARGQVFGLWQVIAVLFVFMSLIFVSMRAGLLALVPNVLPIIVLFGLMGWTGISLNISTSMIAVIAIGIAVDDTIHYFTEFNHQLRRTGNQETAILETVRIVGKPIVFSAIALIAGFAIVCLSNFQPIRHFGVLASVTMLVDLLAELMITPALVMTTTIITLWDLMFVKIGPDPEKQIPLFAGLRPFQAKIVVLMGRLASARPGDYVTRRGEMKPELYVLLRGLVDVRHGAGEPVIRQLGRGEVIGEMGLVRQRPRSADIIVNQDTEYLVLDGGFLDRLQRRHPRIAAKVFLNLTRILSDRLESTTDELARARH